MPNYTKEAMTFPMLPMRGIMLFPGTVLHFDVGREKSLESLEQARARDSRIFLVSQKVMELENPAQEDLYTVGTVARIKQIVKLPGANSRVIVEGLERAELVSVMDRGTYYEADVEVIHSGGTVVSAEMDALLAAARTYFEDYCRASGKNNADSRRVLGEIQDPGQLADILAANILSKLEERMSILEMFDDAKRLEKVCALILRETEMAGIEKVVQARVREQVQENQKEALI